MTPKELTIYTNQRFKNLTILEYNDKYCTYKLATDGYKYVIVKINGYFIDYRYGDTDEYIMVCNSNSVIKVWNRVKRDDFLIEYKITKLLNKVYNNEEL